MSVLVNGTEDLPSGLTPAAAYALINTAIQKLALMCVHEQVVQFAGLVKDGAVAGKTAIPIERLLTAVEISVDGDAPSGGAFTVEVMINGSIQAQAFSVTAGNGYALVAVTGGLVIPANGNAAVFVSAGNHATDVRVTLKSQLRIL
jgi:hypothetical protein